MVSRYHRDEIEITFRRSPVYKTEGNRLLSITTPTTEAVHLYYELRDLLRSADLLKD